MTISASACPGRHPAGPGAAGPQRRPAPGAGPCPRDAALQPAPGRTQREVFNAARPRSAVRQPSPAAPPAARSPLQQRGALASEALLPRPIPTGVEEEARIRALESANSHMASELAAIRGMIERQLAGFAWGE